MLAPIRHRIRDLVYPGLDLHTRNRASLCCFWQNGPRDVLDAGSGNGYFSWLAYQSGARVVAMNYEQEQVEKAKEFLIVHKGQTQDGCSLNGAIYTIYRARPGAFDEVICFEVLEHLVRDRDVIAQFYRILRPGGVLHLCCPYRLHPRHKAEVLDATESGGHVRAGYTEDDYRKLLEPVGFKIERVVGIGSPAVYHADRVLRAIRNRFGDAPALPFLPIALPAIWLATFNPRIPFSLYTKAIKSGDSR